MRSTFLIPLVLVLAFTATSCKQDAAAEKPGAGTEDSTAKAAGTEEKSDGLFGGIFSDDKADAKQDLGNFKLLEVSLGTALDSDNMVSQAKTRFTAKDKIYASVLSSGIHQGLTISARWTAPDGTLVAETRQALVPAGGTVSTFSISKEKAWPVGAYTLDIAINDLVQRTVSFEIK